MNFTETEIYAMARFFIGAEWQNLPINPLLKVMLSNLDRNDDQKKKAFFELLGDGVLERVFYVDPTKELKIAVAAKKTTPIPSLEMPDLPVRVKLSAAQIEEGRNVGKWITDYVTWAGRTANQTPLIFHEGAALFLGAMSLGRRTYLNTPWNQKVYGNLFVMAVALSTYYRKTTSLDMAADVARSAFPNLLLPEPGSPENFMHLLSGKLPFDFEKLPPDDQQYWLRVSSVAAQRSIMRDEISGLFRSMGKDYMAGMKERVMEMYNCPDERKFSTNGKGEIVVRNVAFSLFGASTPAELANSLTPSDWQNGNMARFALLTPELDYKERPRNLTSEPPTELIRRLKHIYSRLPEVRVPTAPGEKPASEEWSLACHVWDQCHEYQEVLREMTAPGSLLDDRLRANYGRFHVSALKLSMMFAVMDWAESGSTDSRPVIEQPHWYRAMTITEEWRASAHRLLHDVSDNTYSQMEAKILGCLSRAPNGCTKSTLLKATHLPARKLDEVLGALLEAGEIDQASQPSAHGRPATVYCVPLSA